MVEEHSDHDLTKLQDEIDTIQQAEQRIDVAITEMERLSNVLSLEEDVTDKAISMYKKSLDSGLSYYPSVAELTAACIYIACRKTQTPRTRAEIAKCSLIPKSGYGRPIRKEGERTKMRGTKIRHMNRSIDMLTNELALNLERIPISNFIYYYCGILDVSQVTKEIALVTAKKLNGKFKSGKSSATLAAGTLCYAIEVSSENITQKSISEATSISVTSIRRRRNEIESEIP